MKKAKIEKLIFEVFKRINFFLKLMGLNFKQSINFFSLFPIYLKDLNNFRKTNQEYSDNFVFGKIYPCLEDKTQNSGEISGHYFYQDCYVAQKIFLAKPQKHVDIGSRIDGFISILATFRNVEVIDIRPLPITLDSVSFHQIDVLGNIPDNLHNYCDSLSCLHTVEHLGLGRYGDHIDYWGYKKGLSNITKILKPEGILYISVPIGPQRIEFNAHRVFSVKYFLELLSVDYSILDFSYIDSENKESSLHKSVNLSDDEINNNFGCYYGCGIFIARKNLKTSATKVDTK